MKLSVMVSLAVTVTSCQGGGVKPRKITTKQTKQTSDDQQAAKKPHAEIINLNTQSFVANNTNCEQAYNCRKEHNITIVASNDITKKFTYSIGTGTECNNWPSPIELITFEEGTPEIHNGKAYKKITVNDPAPNTDGARILCVKGATESEQLQEVIAENSKKKWQYKKECPKASRPPDIEFDGDRVQGTQGDETTPKTIIKEDVGKWKIDGDVTEDQVTINVRKETNNSSATHYAFAYTCEEGEKASCPTSHNCSSKDIETPIDIESNDLPQACCVSVWGVNNGNYSKSPKQLHWKFGADRTDGSSDDSSPSPEPEENRVEIDNRPQGCSNQTTITVSATEPIDQYKYKIYNDHRDCPANDSYGDDLHDLSEDIMIPPTNGEKTLCVIGLGDDDYVQRIPTKHQWIHHQQPLAEPQNAQTPGLEPDTSGPIDLVAGSLNIATPPVNIKNTSGRSFEWELYVYNQVYETRNLLQVKKTENTDTGSDGWHDLNSCGTILEGQLGPGESQPLQFRLKDYQKTDYGRPYLRPTEIAIRRKNYIRPIRLAVNLKIPKLEMKFQTVTLNQQGIPLVTLGPSRKSQQIEIVDSSGNQLAPIYNIVHGFNWRQYPVYFKPKWFYRIWEIEDGRYFLKIGLVRKDEVPWPEKTKTTRIVVYSNGDSKNAKSGIKTRNTKHEWTHEEKNGDRAPKKHRIPYDSAYNYIEVVFDPEL